MTTSYGGITIQKSNPESTRTVFADGVCHYALHVLGAGASLTIDQLAECTVFVVPGPRPVTVEARVRGEKVSLSQGDALDARGHEIALSNGGLDEARILVAGTRGTARGTATRVTRSGEHVKVAQPWGHELLLNASNPTYVLKEVHRLAGRKTSLQYHRAVRETHFLLAGRASVEFKQSASVPHADVTDADLGQVEIASLTSIDIPPQALHRIQALTDVTAYEASTPHHEEVIRVQDDHSRKIGQEQLQVVILTAGKGDRMGGLCDVLNKALLPVEGKAVISQIIEKFPKTSRFVVALGYKGEQVRNYLLAAYPSHEIEFVTIDNYDRPGAGPGYSLKKCQPAVGTKPFYFVTCDTLVEDNIPLDLHQDWMGVCGVNYAISDRYCNFTIEAGKIVAMADKEPYRDNHSKSYIGLSYIHDTEEFWRGLSKNDLRKGEWQMTNGIDHLIRQRPVMAIDFRWTDVGSYQAYVDLTSKADGFDFGKTNEFLFFTNGRVIKFFNDAQIGENRVARARANPAVFPRIDFAGGQFYAYPFVAGTTLYERHDRRAFGELLAFLEREVWKPRDGAGLTALCEAFYRTKTMQRMEAFFEKYPKLRGNERPINGVRYPAAELLLEKLDWDLLTRTHVPAFIHGDLQFDNILVAGNGFKLIDWRQDFGGSLETGDLYYDLAKLYGGLILNYDLIKKSQFSYAEDDNEISFDFSTRGSMSDYRRMLERFVRERGYSMEKVEKLVGIIYLNMAPLHHYPFDKMLYALGTKVLHEGLVDRS